MRASASLKIISHTTSRINSEIFINIDKIFYEKKKLIENLINEYAIESMI